MGESIVFPECSLPRETPDLLQTVRLLLVKIAAARERKVKPRCSFRLSALYFVCLPVRILYPPVATRNNCRAGFKGWNFLHFAL